MLVIARKKLSKRKKRLRKQLRIKYLLTAFIFPEEYPHMEDIMYESIYQPDPENTYPKEVIYYPQVRVYWDDWGQRKDDHCLIALVESIITGAVWIRLLCLKRIAIRGLEIK